MQLVVVVLHVAHCWAQVKQILLEADETCPEGQVFEHTVVPN